MRRKKRGFAWAILLFVVLAGGAATAYFHREAILCSKAGEWLFGHKSLQPITVYFCPMHPQYKSDKPGACPICGMDLVKAEPEKEEPPQPPEKPSETATGSTKKPSGAATGPAGERKVLYWIDPMDPSHRYDKPGKAPDGMDLTPVYAEEAGAATGGKLPAGTIHISPRKQQLIGVQLGEAAEQRLEKTIRAAARLAYDETRIARVQPRVSGWIDHVSVDFTGRLVKKNQPLLSVYSPELVSTQQELLVAAKAREALAKSPYPDVASGARSLYDSTRERLRLYNISEAQIGEIEKRGSPVTAMTLASPISGFVIARNAYPGQRVAPETELYTIADLSTVWALAEIYEYEAPMVRLGQEATMTLAGFPGQVFKGKVGYIYPDLDKSTRTIKVRIEFPNPRFELKPDMYANVEFHIDFGNRLSVPEEAVLDSGAEQIVFVAHGDGYFEPRKVGLGEKVGGRYVVLGGLAAGERVVTSANFLIDSESKLKSAIGGMEDAAGHDQ